MTLAEALAAATKSLELAGVESAKTDATWLLAHALKMSKGELVTKLSLGEQIDETGLVDYESLVAQRQKRIPLQHIIGTAGFLNLELLVGPGVFIPRPETEVLVELASSYLNQNQTARVLDIGTGSGAIAISLARAFPQAEVIAIEISPEAAKYTAENIAGNQVSIELRVGEFQRSDCRSGGPDRSAGIKPAIHSVDCNSQRS